MSWIMGSKQQVFLCLLLAASALIVFYNVQVQTYETSAPRAFRWGVFHRDTSRNLQTLAEVKSKAQVIKVPPRTSLVFIKTHRTGGTTLGKILNRYGYTRNLSFLLYRDDWSKSGQFMHQIPTKPSEVYPPIGVEGGDYDNYKNYDFMTSHCRLLPSSPFFQDVMRPDSRYVTILRNPVSLWESAFFSYKCHFEYDGRDGDSNTINEFFNASSANTKLLRGNCKHYLRDGLYLDLTDDKPIHNNGTVITDTIRKLDEQLDLVLIVEYFDESLLLLKHLMHWEFTDILYIKANQRVQRQELSELQIALIKEWNTADSILYNHFNITLWRKIAQYEGDFQQDMTYFRQLLHIHHEECGLQNSTTRFRKEYAYSVTSSTSRCQTLGGIDYKKLVSRQFTPHVATIRRIQH